MPRVTARCFAEAFLDRVLDVLLQSRCGSHSVGSNIALQLSSSPWSLNDPKDWVDARKVLGEEE
jgi:hypothetical protein